MKAKLYLLFFFVQLITAMEIEISITNQELTLRDDNGVIKTYKISTSKYGEGSTENSFKTPLGKHEIKKMIGDWLITQSPQHWLDILQPADIWCAEVLEWDKMMQNDGFKVLDMLQRIKRFDGLDIQTLRCPIRINDQIYKSDRAAPVVGQHTKQISEEFSL